MALSLLWRHKKWSDKLSNMCVDASPLKALLLLISSSIVLTIFTATLLTPSSLRSRFPSFPSWWWARESHYNVVLTADSANDTLCEYSDVDQLPPAQEDQIAHLLNISQDSLINYRPNAADLKNRQFSRWSPTRFVGIGGEWRLHGRRSPYPHHGAFRMSAIRTPGYQLELSHDKIKWSPFFPMVRSLLMQWVESRKFKPKIMHEIVAAVKGPIDENYMRLAVNRGVPVLGKKYRTCAVVGNSGLLLQQGYGALIDSHDMVMRINNARTSGFEKFVGSKTTISFINSHILRACARRSRCFCHPYGDSVPIVTYICEPWHFFHVAFCSSSFTTAPLIVTNPQFDNLCNRIAKWYSVTSFLSDQPSQHASAWTPLRNRKRVFHNSSGMQAVLVALAICDHVDLFGFGKNKAAKHHYHTSQMQELRDVHDYNAEYRFYNDLENNRSNQAVIPFLHAAEFYPATFRVFA